MGKKGANPTATMGETVKVPTILDVASGNGKVLTMVEVDPATENPALLDAIRKKNSAALTSILDPRDDPSTKDSSNAADAVWYLGINGCHITGNLNLLTDIKPVYDRWVKSLNGGPPMQVCARGSVNCNGIKLDDVWYVPGVTVNVVEVAHFSDQELQVSMGGGGCSIERPDGTVLGKGHRKDRLYELDFLNITRPPGSYTHGRDAAGVWQGVPELHPARCPWRQLRPGAYREHHLRTQLIDSGFSVSFGPHGCTVMRNRGGAMVGYAYHAGSQLYRLDYLRVAASK